MKTFYRNTIFIFLFFCILILTGGNLVKKDVAILDQDKKIQVKTVSRNVKKLLSKYDLELRESDKVIPNLSSKLEDGMEIQIIRSFPVKISNGDEQIEFYTTSNNVKTILLEANISLNDLDRVYPQLNENIKADKEIEIIRIKEDIIRDEETTPYISYAKRTDSLKSGEKKVEVKGSFGECEKKYKVIYENGKEISRELVSFSDLKSSEDEKVLIGKEKYLVLDDGSPYRYSRVMDMVATAYDLSYESCGKYPENPGYGITYSGTKARPGVVAVDPKVIGLKTKIYVESLDKTKDYGFSSAEDTGSAIKGNRIDVFIGNSRNALRYGKRSVRVYVLDELIDENLMVGYAY